MNYLMVFDRIKQLASRSLFLQLVSAGFLVLIAWEITSSIVLFSGLKQKIKLHANTNQEDAVVLESKTMALALQHPIFGDYVPKNLDAAGIRQSMLNLTVVGVIFAAVEHDSQVLLQKPNGEELFFHVGEDVPGGGVIKRITAEGVLVLRDGVLERLSLPKEELNFEASAMPLEE